MARTETRKGTHMRRGTRRLQATCSPSPQAEKLSSLAAVDGRSLGGGKGSGIGRSEPIHSTNSSPRHKGEMGMTSKKLRKEKHMKRQARATRALLLAGQFALAPLGSIGGPRPKKASHLAPKAQQHPATRSGDIFAKEAPAKRLRKRALGIAASAAVLTATATVSRRNNLPGCSALPAPPRPTP